MAPDHRSRPSRGLPIRRSRVRPSGRFRRHLRARKSRRIRRRATSRKCRRCRSKKRSNKWLRLDRRSPQESPPQNLPQRRPSSLSHCLRHRTLSVVRLRLARRQSVKRKRRQLLRFRRCAIPQCHSRALMRPPVVIARSRDFLPRRGLLVIRAHRDRAVPIHSKSSRPIHRFGCVRHRLRLLALRRWRRCFGPLWAVLSSVDR